MTAVTGTARLTFFALRVDRRRSTAWVLAVGGFVVVVGLAFNRLYPTGSSRLRLVPLANSNFLRAILGPLLAPTTTGGLVAWRMGSILVVVLALATTFLVVARTRGEEQHGRGALVDAAPVGRGARTLAALLDAAALDAAAALAVTLALCCFAQPLGPSLAFGACVGLAAWCFGGVAALVAQVATTSKGANGVAAGVVAVAFLLRALGQLWVGWLEWLSPMGWVGRLSPFAELRPAVLFAPLAVGLLAAAGAIGLASSREAGAGLFKERPAASHDVEGTPRALAWRLERAGIAVTLVAAFAYSVLAGSIVGLFNSFVSQNPTFLTYIEAIGGLHGLKDAFTTVMAIYGGVAIGAWAVALVLRLHTEEDRGRVELLVATSATRTSVVDGFTVTAVGAATVGMLAWGLGLGLGRLIADHTAGSVADGVEAGAVVLPATLVLVAVAVLAVGATRHAAVLAWGAVVWCAMVSVLGPFLGLPSFFSDLSPFTHVAPIPLAGTWWVRGVALLAVAGAVLAAGRAAYGRRELRGL